MVSLSISGAYDTERKAGLQMPDLQQNHCQVMDEQQSIDQWYCKLHYAVVVLFLLSTESKAINQLGQNDMHWICFEGVNNSIKKIIIWSNTIA